MPGRDRPRLVRSQHGPRGRVRPRAWREANKDRKAETARAWHEANKDRSAETDRAWREANPDKCRAQRARRRARKANATVELFTADVLAAYWDEMGWYQCVYCSGVLGKVEHADHIQPLSKGGVHAPDNLVPACRACNLAKHASDPWDFIPRRLAEVEEILAEAGL